MAGYVENLFNKELKKPMKDMLQAEKNIRKSIDAYCKMIVKGSDNIDSYGIPDRQTMIHVRLTADAVNNMSFKLRSNVSVFFDAVSAGVLQKAINELKIAFPNASVGRYGPDSVIVHDESIEIY